MKVLLLGGTGVAGRATLRWLRERGGHDVSAVVRDERGRRVVTELGARPVTGDQRDPRRLRDWLQDVDVAVDLRVRLPAASRAVLPGAWRDYVALRDTEAGRLADAVIDVGTPRLVHDTVTMVYADGGDAWLDEDSPVDARGFLAANLACEEHLARVTAAGGVGIALRFGQFYGPDDAMSRQAARAVRRGFWPLPGAPRAFSSAVHTDDVGSAVGLAATTRGIEPGVHDVVDEEPLRTEELLAVLSTAVGRRVRAPFAPLARVVPALGRSQRVRGERFRAATGWQSTVPTRRIGWPAVLDRLR
ncbi:MAG TPA: NAD(P)-dependent oxidoreductase [Pseudonocardiaceae bacterium]